MWSEFTEFADAAGIQCYPASQAHAHALCGFVISVWLKLPECTFSDGLGDGGVVRNGIHESGDPGRMLFHEAVQKSSVLASQLLWLSDECHSDE